jgi:hypothetical protein
MLFFSQEDCAFVRSSDEMRDSRTVRVRTDLCYTPMGEPVGNGRGIPMSEYFDEHVTVDPTTSVI